MVAVAVDPAKEETVFPVAQPAALIRMVDLLSQDGDLPSALRNPGHFSKTVGMTPGSFANFLERYSAAELHAVYVPIGSHYYPADLAESVDWINDVTGDKLDFYVDAADLRSKIQFDLDAPPIAGTILASRLGRQSTDCVLVWQDSLGESELIETVTFAGKDRIERTSSGIITALSALLEYWQYTQNLSAAATAARSMPYKALKRPGVGLLRKAADSIPLLVSSDTRLRRSLERIDEAYGIDYRLLVKELDRLANKDFQDGKVLAWSIPRTVLKVAVVVTIAAGVAADYGGAWGAIDDLNKWGRQRVAGIVELGEEIAKSVS